MTINQENNNEQEGKISIDVYYKDNELVILSPIAGVNKENIEVILQGDILVIKGYRWPPEQVEENAYKYKECFWGSFSRTITLPKNLDTQNIKAHYHNGILIIRIPQKGEQTVKKIEIHSEN